VLVHFHVLHGFSNIFPYYLFPSLVNDTDILGCAHVITFSFDHFVSNQFLWGWLFNFTIPWLGPLLACLLVHLFSWFLLPYR
jgi:hypothetical protein